MPINRLHISKLADEYQSDRINFITRSSFEIRWTVCPNALRDCDFSHILIFQSEAKSDEARRSCDEICNKSFDMVVTIDLIKSNAEKTYKSLRNNLDTCFTNNQGELNLIDISCFKREELLMVLSILRDLNEQFPDVKCRLLYSEVDNMAEDWLSRNTCEVRTVLGYSGDPMQSKRTCVIAMVGHEFNRAKDIIDVYDPSKLMIGRGLEGESINRELYERNITFYKELKAYYGQGCSEFEFSLLDPFKVKALLSNLCSDDQYNYVIVPLNNKISCLGAGLFALENSDVQICYSEMLEYNKVPYSTPGEYIHILNVNDFWAD